MARHREARLAGEAGDRALEARIAERDDVPTAVADEVVVVIGAPARGLVAGALAAQLEALDEVQVAQALEHAIDRRPPDAAALGAELLGEIGRRDRAVLLGELLDDGPADMAAVATALEQLDRPLAPLIGHEISVPLPRWWYARRHLRERISIPISREPGAERTAFAAHGLTVRYGPVVALEDLSFEVPAGARVAVLGPNGSGKSTLFATAVGLLRPAAGTIEIASRRVAYLPQQLHVDPAFPITVADVVSMGRWGDLGWVRRPSRRDREIVADAMDQLGIAELAGRRLSELSGGQRQRALVAQSVAQQADVLLLDEPFTGVDRPTADAIRTLMRRWSDEGRTVLVATHDLERSARDFDLSLALNRRAVAFGPSCDVACDDVLRATFGDAPAVEGAGHALEAHAHV